jgi:hypothetical protein
MKIGGTEGVVRKNLENEGASVAPDVIRTQLKQNVMNSGLEGDALNSALKKIDREIDGLMIRASADGKIPLTVLHDAKIATTNGINYMTEPFVKSERKAVANAYKTLIENNSNVTVVVDGKKYKIKDINAELGKYLKDIELLESLDGRKVKGGRLGKYFAQATGTIIGGVAGGAVGGPFGAAAGTMIGAEMGSRIKGSLLERSLGRSANKPVTRSPILDAAVKQSEAGRLMLPAPKSGAVRTQQGSGPTIPVAPKGSNIDFTGKTAGVTNKENKLGSLNLNQSKTATTKKKANMDAIVAPAQKKNSEVIPENKKELRKTVSEKERNEGLKIRAKLISEQKEIKKTLTEVAEKNKTASPEEKARLEKEYKPLVDRYKALEGISERDLPETRIE